MEWEIVEAIPPPLPVERLTDRFGREDSEQRRREQEIRRRPPLHEWQGMVVDIFA